MKRVIAALLTALTCQVASAQADKPLTNEDPGPPPPPPGTPLPYFEGFESSTGGFTVGGSSSSWEWGVPAGDFIDTAAEGSQAWVTNLAGDHHLFESSYLQSPVFDFTQRSRDPWLQFKLLHDFPTTASRAWLELSVNGGPFVKAPPSPGGLYWYTNTTSQWWTGRPNELGQWRTTRFRLNGAAGSTVQVRWVCDTGSSRLGGGLGVDSVTIYDNLLDASVTRVDGPDSGPLLLQESVDVIVRNTGTQNISGFPVTLDISGPVPTQLTQPFLGTLTPAEEQPMLFEVPIDLSVPGVYTLQAEALLDGDEVPGNNFSQSQVTHQETVRQFPYFEGFEDGPSGYIVNGVNPSWEHGEPAGPVISRAAFGARAWVTNLDGGRTRNEFSFLRSPPIDLTEVENDPLLQFSMTRDFGNSDRAWIEVSFNGEAFQELGTSEDPFSLNWYPNSANRWTGSTAPNDWVIARNVMLGAAGNVVTLRWVMDADLEENFDGFGVDNVEIFETPFGIGQKPRPSISVLDINQATEALGYSVEAFQPGPYFVALSGSSDVLHLHVEGEPGQPIVWIAGELDPAAASTPFGQIDLGVDAAVIASGYQPGGFNQFFFTNNEGVMDLTLPIPLTLIGRVLSFQAGVGNTELDIAITNAVQVSFLP